MNKCHWKTSKTVWISSMLKMHFENMLTRYDHYSPTFLAFHVHYSWRSTFEIIPWTNPLYLEKSFTWWKTNCSEMSNHDVKLEALHQTFSKVEIAKTPNQGRCSHVMGRFLAQHFLHFWAIWQNYPLSKSLKAKGLKPVPACPTCMPHLLQIDKIQSQDSKR